MGSALNGETTYRPVVLNNRMILFPTPGHLAMSREIFLVVTAGWELLLASSGWRPRVLVNILQRRGQISDEEVSGQNVSSAEIAKSCCRQMSQTDVTSKTYVWLKPRIFRKSYKLLRKRQEPNRTLTNKQFTEKENLLAHKYKWRVPQSP